MLDICHAQFGVGNRMALIEKAFAFVGEAQAADVPGRCELGAGEINYPAIAAKLQKLGCDGTISPGGVSGQRPLATSGFRDTFEV